MSEPLTKEEEAEVRRNVVRMGNFSRSEQDYINRILATLDAARLSAAVAREEALEEAALMLFEKRFDDDFASIPATDRVAAAIRALKVSGQ